jgi:hypothetical protein
MPNHRPETENVSTKAAGHGKGKRGSGLAADALAGKSGLSDCRIVIGLTPLIPRVDSRKQAWFFVGAFLTSLIGRI